MRKPTGLVVEDNDAMDRIRRGEPGVQTTKHRSDTVLERPSHFRNEDSSHRSTPRRRPSLGRVLAWAVFLVISTGHAGFAETIKIGGTGGAMAAMDILGKAFERAHPGTKVTVLPGLGSRGGKKALLAGAIDLAVSADPLTTAERDQGLAALDFVRTPFVFITSRANAASGLSMKELVDIYNGTTTTWPDGTRLRLILRPPLDSDTTALRAISPAMDRAVQAALTRPGMINAPSDQDAVDAIDQVPGSLGISTLGLLISEKRSVKVLALDGVVPSTKAMAEGAYPYFKTLRAITRHDPSPLVRRFLAYLQSPQGQDTFSTLGFSPVGAKAGR